MKRLAALVAVVLVAGCEVEREPAPDAAPQGSLYAPVGESCSAAESYWCAAYAGVCVRGVCRAQCSAVAFPRCGSGEMEVVEDLGVGRQCYCVPRL
jgi:hypothetical protein